MKFEFNDKQVTNLRNIISTYPIPSAQLAESRVIIKEFEKLLEILNNPIKEEEKPVEPVKEEVKKEEEKPVEEIKKE